MRHDPVAGLEVLDPSAHRDDLSRDLVSEDRSGLAADVPIEDPIRRCPMRVRINASPGPICGTSISTTETEPSDSIRTAFMKQKREAGSGKRKRT
jgi:hypothetical protein